MITVKLHSKADKRAKILSKYKTNRRVYAGVFDTAENSETGESVAEYAAQNEFGTDRIPSRPFMRRTIMRCQDEWIQKFGEILKSGVNVDEALTLMGKQMQADIQQTILDDVPPPNSPVTIAMKARKGSSGDVSQGTLRDTGSLYNSIEFQVR